MKNSKRKPKEKEKTLLQSANNRGFTPQTVKPIKMIEKLNGSDDDDVRLGRMKDAEQDALKIDSAIKSVGGKKVMQIYDEYPSNIKIQAMVPDDNEDAIKFYTTLLRKFPVEKHPEEFGITHYFLGKTFSCSKRDPLIHHSVIKKELDVRAKMIENALFHFNKALQVFGYVSHPMMFAVISTMVGQLYRERAMIMNNRCFLSKRGGTIEECIQKGLDTLMEAFPVFAQSKPHSVEHACCALETGWLYIMQSDLSIFKTDPLTREQSITYLERALSLAQQAENPFRDGKPRLWDPNNVDTHPSHVSLMLYRRPLTFLEGMGMFLLGKVYQEWGMNLEYQEQAFKYFSQCVRPKYLPLDCEYWGEAHHRCACVILQCPNVVDPEYFPSGNGQFYSSELYIDAAISHLNLAGRCAGLANCMMMDVYFHAALAYLAKFNNITDKIPPGESLTLALMASEGLGLEHMRSVENNLRDALTLVTAASTQSTQDGYVYFYSCLKLADFRMLESAIQRGISSEEREVLLKEAIAFIVNALLSRPLAENFDLHYIAIIQFAQTVLAGRRGHAASKTGAKLLLTFSVILNRMLFLPSASTSEPLVSIPRLTDELNKSVTHCMKSCSMEIVWVKKHLGAKIVTNSITPGYASWSFEHEAQWGEVLGKKYPEDNIAVEETSTSKEGGKSSKPPRNSVDESNKPKTDSPPAPESELQVEVNANAERPASAGDARDLSQYQLTAADRAPPREPPPEKHIHLKTEIPAFSKSAKGRVQLAQLDFSKLTPQGPPSMPPPSLLHGDGGMHVNTSQKEGGWSENTKLFAVTPQRPRGLPPLSAFGHRPDLQPDGQLHEDGPYGLRKRTRVTSLEEMQKIRDREAYARAAAKRDQGFIASLMPTHGTLTQGKKKENEWNSGAVLERIRPRHEVNAYEKSRQGLDVDEEEKEAIGPLGVKFTKKKVHFPAPTSSWDKVNEDDDSDDENIENAFSIRFSSLVNGLRSFVAEKRAMIMHRAEGAIEVINDIKQRLPRPEGSRERQQRKQRRIAIMWSSTQAYYALMCMSRASRLQLMLRVANLKVLHGQRALFVLKELPQSLQDDYKIAVTELKNACKSIIMSPQTLKELGSRSFRDLAAIFDSQTTIYYNIEELEKLLRDRVSPSEDCFLPMVLTPTTLTKDITVLDENIQNVEKLSSQMKAEHEEAAKRQEMKTARSEHNHDSTSPPSKLLGKAATEQYNAIQLGVGSSLDDKQPTLEEEDQEADRLGKMTYVLSQNLDGSWKGDIRGMLAKYLGRNECFLQWHLPVQSSHSSSAASTAMQSIQVVMAWRVDDRAARAAARKRAKDADRNCKEKDKSKSGKSGKDDDGEEEPDEETAQKQVESSSHFSKVLNVVSTAATAVQKVSEVAQVVGLPALTAAGVIKPEPKEQPEEECGIVVEIARCDLDTKKLHQLIQSYIDALHTRPQPRRQSLVNDALRLLSTHLALGELLSMAPSSTNALVICCPPCMRTIPWHALLIEVEVDPILPSVDTMEKGSSREETGSTKGVVGASGLSGKGQRGSVANIAEFAKAPTHSPKKLQECNLVEKYAVRLGPTLSVWEICANTANRFSQAVGFHKLCAIDGEDEDARGKGLRSTETEVSCVVNTWSGDSEDYRVCEGVAACPGNLLTLCAGGSKMERPVVLGEEKSDLIIELEMSRIKNERRVALEKKKKSKKLDQKKKMDAVAEDSGRPRYVHRHSSDESDIDSGDSDFGENELIEMVADRAALTTCRVLHVGALKRMDEAAIVNMKRLSGEPQSQLPPISNSNAGSAPPPLSLPAAISLPRTDKAKRSIERQVDRARKHFQALHGDEDGDPGRIKNGPAKLIDERDCLTAKDFINQIYLRNCALCVLSRFALTDDVFMAGNRFAEPNTEFVEGIHLAGACSVLYPLWGGYNQGSLGVLSTLLFLVRFYTDLPLYSREKNSISHALQQTQIWLKNVTGNEVISFLSKAPLPRKVRDDLVGEMQSFINSAPGGSEMTPRKTTSGPELGKPVHASVTSVLASLGGFDNPNALNNHGMVVHNNGTSNSKNDESNPTSPDSKKPQQQPVTSPTTSSGAGAKKYFSHILYWGAFTLSGHGGGVHHPDLAEEGETQQKKLKDNVGGRDFDKDADLGNIQYEINFLKMEGRLDEAKELERFMKEDKKLKRKQRMDKIKATGALAGRKIMDGLDRLDKAFLDQDSDGISVSDEDNNEMNNGSGGGGGVVNNRKKKNNTIHQPKSMTAIALSSAQNMKMGINRFALFPGRHPSIPNKIQPLPLTDRHQSRQDNSNNNSGDNNDDDDNDDEDDEEQRQQQQQQQKEVFEEEDPEKQRKLIAKCLEEKLAREALDKEAARKELLDHRQHQHRHGHTHKSKASSGSKSGRKKKSGKARSRGGASSVNSGSYLDGGLDGGSSCELYGDEEHEGSESDNNSVDAAVLQVSKASLRNARKYQQDTVNNTATEAKNNKNKNNEKDLETKNALAAFTAQEMLSKLPKQGTAAIQSEVCSIC